MLILLEHYYYYFMNLFLKFGWHQFKKNDLYQNDCQKTIIYQLDTQ